MKKQITILSAAFMALAMASCSSELAVNEAQPTTDIMISVKADAPIAGRAISTVDGYTLTCVMQLLNDGGSIVGTNATSEITAGGAQFTIKAADIDAGASKAIFFAHYVPTAGGSQVYDVTDLTNITYKTTELDITDGKLVSAADAFAGSLTTLTNGASVTLTRPFIQLNLTPYNPEAAEGATTLTVKYNAYQGYNVLTQAINTSDSEELTFTNTTFDTGASKWFTSYIFAPSNQSKFDQPITMTLGGGKSMNLNINPGDLIPLDANYIVNAGFTINAEEPEQDIEIDVTIDGDFVNEPKPAVFEVGAYVDAAGNPTNEKSQAVGVIFATEPVSIVVSGQTYTDDISKYDGTYTGKKIKGYAIALESTTTKRSSINDENVSGLTPTEKEATIVNGTQNTENVIAYQGITGSVVANSVGTFRTEKALTAKDSYTTDWYIPAQPQLQAFSTLLYQTTWLDNSSNGPTATESFKTLFPNDVMNDDPSKANVNYISCSVNTGGNLMALQLATNATGDPFTASFKGVNITGSTTQNVLCRLMFTIFEDAE